MPDHLLDRQKHICAYVFRLLQQENTERTLLSEDLLVQVGRVVRLENRFYHMFGPKFLPCYNGKLHLP